MCRQAAAALCDESSQPANRRPCGQAPCALTARTPLLVLGAWGGCEDACGPSWAARAAVCANRDARLTDLDQCAPYNGAEPLLGCML